MRRTLLASLLPMAAIVLAWCRTERPASWSGALVVAGCALATALPRRPSMRAAALALAIGSVAVVVGGVRPWPGGDEGALEPVLRTLSVGIGEFYGVALPFHPDRHESMHAVVLIAVFGFVAATAQLVAARKPLPAAVAALGGVAWPTTLVDPGAVGLGALALAAALWALVVLGAPSVRGGLVALVAVVLIVGSAAWGASTIGLGTGSALDWRSWDFRGVPASALGVRFVWDANYDGISFPPTRTTVLEIAGPESAQYWRVSTLDRFTSDRWFEEHEPQRVGPAEGELAQDGLVPARARDRSRWLEQRVEVKALVDDRIAAAGTPMAIDGQSLGTVFQLTSGVLRARRAVPAGTRYRVWSYVPAPSPRALQAAPPAYPRAARRFLVVWGRSLLPFGAPRRDASIRAELTDRALGIAEYRPLYEVARRVTRGAETPYGAVLALESWFRTRGGFVYDERPERLASTPPLVEFVTESRRGYCQHYAGAMAVMLRLLGVPARVAVGFTSGRRVGAVWQVTDHDAHAWVEVWFPSIGWVAFDPTPGRGRLSGVYSFASENARAVAALRRGDLEAAAATADRDVTGALARETTASRRGGSPLPGAVALAALALAIGVGVAKTAVRRARYLAGDPRSLATAARRELEGFLRDQGVSVDRNATLVDVGRLVREELGVDGRRFVAVAARARFGPPQDAPLAAAAARRELRVLLRASRDVLSPWRRLRGFVSLRSLVGGS